MIRDLKICPTCGANRLRLVTRTLREKYHGVLHVVPNVEFHECQSCGEQLFGAEAMRKIEQSSAAYTRKLSRSKLAGARKFSTTAVRSRVETKGTRKWT